MAAEEEGGTMEGGEGRRVERKLLRCMWEGDWWGGERKSSTYIAVPFLGTSCSRL